MASRKKSGAKFDPFGPQREITKGVVNAAKSAASNAQAVADLIRGTVSGGGGTRSMTRGMNPGRSNMAGSMVSAYSKKTVDPVSYVAPKTPVPSLKKIAEEKNRKVPLGPNKPAPKKSAPKPAPKKKSRNKDNKGTPYYGMP